MPDAYDCYLTSGNEKQKKLWSAGVAKSSDSHVDERKNAYRASVVRMLTIVVGARSDTVTLSNRTVKSSTVNQVDCDGVARSDDLLLGLIPRKLNTFVLPLAVDAYAQKTEVYYSALQTTYRLSTISGRR